MGGHLPPAIQGPDDFPIEISSFFRGRFWAPISI